MNDENTPGSDRKIVLIREFDAPRAVVFEAWTKSEHVSKWWDPSGIPLSTCEIDLRPNGVFRWINSAHGDDHVFAGQYREITPPERLVFSVDFFPGQPAPVTTLLFGEEDGKTILTMTIECPSHEVREAMLHMGIDVGTGMTLQKLSEYLGTIELVD